MKSERFRTIGSLFTFGRYKDLSLSDVLDMNPGYVYWCMAHLTPMSSRLCFYIDDFAMNEISALYPQFIVPKELLKITCLGTDHHPYKRKKRIRLPNPN